MTPALSNKWLPVCSLLLNWGFYHFPSSSSFASSISGLFHHHLGAVTGESYASPVLVAQWQSRFLCSIIQPSSIAVKIPPNSTVKVITLCNHYLLKKKKKDCIASLNWFFFVIVVLSMSFFGAGKSLQAEASPLIQVCASVCVLQAGEKQFIILLNKKNLEIVPSPRF